MRVRVCTLLLGLGKVTLAAAATVCLFVFFLLMTSSPGMEPPDDYSGHAIGWILLPAFYAAAAFLVAVLTGVLWISDRWIVRPAATIPLIWILYYLVRGLLQLLNGGPHFQVTLYVRWIMLPVVCTAVIVFLFSPFFHDCGHALRETRGMVVFRTIAGPWDREHRNR